VITIHYPEVVIGELGPENIRMSNDLAAILDPNECEGIFSRETEVEVYSVRSYFLNLCILKPGPMLQISFPIAMGVVVLLTTIKNTPFIASLATQAEESG
jgi:hypothetical protein